MTAKTPHYLTIRESSCLATYSLALMSSLNLSATASDYTKSICVVDILSGCTEELGR